MEQTKVGIRFHRIAQGVRKPMERCIQNAGSLPQSFRRIYVEWSAVRLHQATKIFLFAVHCAVAIGKSRGTKVFSSGRTRHFFLALSFTLRTTTVSSSKAS